MSTRTKLAPKAPTKVVRLTEKSTSDRVVQKTEKTVPLKIVKKKVESDSDSDSDSEIYEIPQKTQKVTKVTKVISKNEDSDSDSEFYGEIPEDKILSMKKRIIKNTITIDSVSSSSDFSDSDNDIKNDSDKKTNYDRSSIDMVDYNRMLFENNSNKSKDSFLQSAWKSLEKYDLPDKKNLKIIKSHPGHFVTMGRYTGSLRNPHWLVEDKDKNKYYIMYCKSGGYTKFSEKDYKEVINPINNHYPTWHREKIGYILTKSYNNIKGHMYLHQLICQKHGEKKFVTQSVDHINKDKLDNRHTNLRFTSQSVQNMNRDKKKRAKNAHELPEGVDQKRDIPIYCGRRRDPYGPNKEYIRFFYTIEGHPLQKIKQKIRDSLPEGQQLPQSEFPIRWASSKSNEVSEEDKIKAMQQKRKAYDREFEEKYPKEFAEWIKNGGKKY